VPVAPDDHIRGSESAAITLVEYGDYECPHCAAVRPEVERALQQFRNELRFVFRHFPLTEIHPHAEAAAESAEYAGAHDRFWEMHDGLYENQHQLGLPLLFVLAKMLRLSEADLRDALETRKFAPKVRKDFLGGVRSGVNGTPTFFLNGMRYDGSYAFEDLAGAIALRFRAKTVG
jgi:protein-disulfide isomerase